MFITINKINFNKETHETTYEEMRVNVNHIITYKASISGTVLVLETTTMIVKESVVIIDEMVNELYASNKGVV